MRLAHLVLGPCALLTTSYIRSSAGKATRLGFMGHLTLLAEEVSKFLETAPVDLCAVLEESFVPSEWASFRDGALSETRERDAKPLGGIKPRDQMPPPSGESDRQDSDSDDEEGTLAKSLTGAPLTRTPGHYEEDFGKREDGDSRKINDNQVSRNVPQSKQMESLIKMFDSSFHATL